MKFVLYQKGKELVLYSLDKNGNKEYAESYEEADEVFNYFNKAGFRILIYGDDLVLSNKDKHVSLTIKRYDTLLERRDVTSLRNIIDSVYEREGAIDKTNVDQISYNHNHSNKHAGKKVARLGAVVLAGVILLGAGIGVKNIVKNNDEAQTYITETQVQESPMHIMDIGDVTYEDGTYTETNGPEEEVEFVDLSNTATLNYEDLSGTEKAIYCKNEYYDLIKSKAPSYGIDPDLMLAVATQERGVHSTTVDTGGGVGLMQIQYDVWVGEDIYFYKLNQNGEYEYHTMTVTDEMMRNLDSNIDLACAIMQNCMEVTAYNIPMAIQMYNQGYGNIHDLLVNYCEENGLDRGELCRTPSDLGWYSKTSDYAGDPEYLEHVLQWASDPNFEVQNIETYEIVEFHFNNGSQVRK